jgi:hypothetical protein
MTDLSIVINAVRIDHPAAARRGVLADPCRRPAWKQPQGLHR